MPAKPAAPTNSTAKTAATASMVRLRRLRSAAFLEATLDFFLERAPGRCRAPRRASAASALGRDRAALLVRVAVRRTGSGSGSGSGSIRSSSSVYRGMTVVSSSSR
nr:hypothetical protein [Nocardia cyriacigeorgica]